jgi:hypothetical protein
LRSGSAAMCLAPENPHRRWGFPQIPCSKDQGFFRGRTGRDQGKNREFMGRPASLFSPQSGIAFPTSVRAARMTRKRRVPSGSPSLEFGYARKMSSATRALTTLTIFSDDRLWGCSPKEIMYLAHLILTRAQGMGAAHLGLPPRWSATRPDSLTGALTTLTTFPRCSIGVLLPGNETTKVAHRGLSEDPDYLSL